VFFIPKYVSLVYCLWVNQEPTQVEQLMVLLGQCVSKKKWTFITKYTSLVNYLRVNQEPTQVEQIMVLLGHCVSKKMDFQY
jgi:hypothetical protein